VPYLSASDVRSRRYTNTRLPLGRRPRWCFSGGSRCERQWEGLCEWRACN